MILPYDEIASLDATESGCLAHCSDMFNEFYVRLSEFMFDNMSNMFEYHFQYYKAQ